VAGGDAWTYGFDHDNRLAWAEHRASDGGALLLRAECTYDAFGNRLQTSVDADGSGPQAAVVTRFAFDGWQSSGGAFGQPYAAAGDETWDMAAELDSANQPMKRYLRGDAIDQVFAELGGAGGGRWYLADRLGTIRDVADGSGAAQDRLNYDGFGKLLSQ